jgi:DNA-directed RNA polymerase subunit RPC12/RpoP
MTEKEITHGLACPRCGGTVPIPEGQVIVNCPYCDLRSMVQGERGMHRYQVPQRITQKQASQALQRFLSSSQAIARDAARRAALQEAFVVHLPFWVSWARALGWVFGQKKVGSGDNARYEPREVRTAQDFTWNGAACDVGEFGVMEVQIDGRPLEPFDPEALHDSGLVFEPVGSVSEARVAAEDDFNQRLKKAAKLDRIAQVFVRLVNQRMGIVYHPLWVLRYLYRDRAYQVVVDGHSGDVLYGKAPGNTLYRAAVLVGGMALGALLAVDGAAAAFYLASEAKGDSVGFLFGAGIVALAAGFGLMGSAYRKFRYGEQYEYHKAPRKAVQGSGLDAGLVISQLQELSSWIDR